MKNYFRPMTIGALKLKNNLIAAPMAGLSSLPYRLLALEGGCALAISEMVSAEGVIRAHSRTKRYFENDPDARPFGVQLFGANADAMEKACREISKCEIDLIDINMGCPVKKVCSKGAGAAMMKNPANAKKVIAAVRRATKLPLTVKIRSGWDEDSINCVEIASLAEAEGADAVIVHPRTRMQGFKGKSDWSFIADVKRAVKIPVIGNGDVKNRRDAIAMIDETGCDGVMIGRAAVGNPWIFNSMLDPEEKLPSKHERGKIALRHFAHLREFLGEKMAVLNMRTILAWYGKGIPGIKKLMHEAHRAKSYKELYDAVEEFFCGHPNQTV